MKIFKAIHRKLDWLIRTSEIICRELQSMSTQTDKLDAAVASLATSVQTLSDNVTANGTEVLAEIEELKAAHEAGDDTAFDASIAKLTTLTDAIGTQAAAVKASTDALVADNAPAAPAPVADPNAPAV